MQKDNTNMIPLSYTKYTILLSYKGNIPYLGWLRFTNKNENFLHKPWPNTTKHLLTPTKPARHPPAAPEDPPNGNFGERPRGNLELVAFADAGTRVSTRIQVIGFRKFKAVEREG